MADSQTAGPRVIVIGGVAGGASTATRLRRVSQHAQIIMVERGPFVSYATCGLPYHVGDVIPEEAKLRVATPQLLEDRFGIDVRVLTEATGLDVKAQTVTLTSVESGETVTEPYDYLVLATGAKAFVPPWSGVDLDGVFTLRTIPHAREIREWIAAAKERVGGGRKVRAGIVGGGFIGLELADALVESGVQASVLEFAPQIMPPMDAEMAKLLETKIADAAGEDLTVAVGDGVNGIQASESDYALEITTAGGASHECDLVIVAVGIKPNSELAAAAGLNLGARGYIAVDASFRTSDPRVFAIGDVAETADRVTGLPMSLALAGPANRAGRIVADAIAKAGASAPPLSVRIGARLPGTHTLSRGVLGSWVCGVFGYVCAGVGASARTLDRAAMPYNMAYAIGGHHVGYYPGAKKLIIKVLYSPHDGRVLGAQAVGEAGVERRIDVIATVIHSGGSVFDLQDLELCYAPAFGAARDMINMVGMVACNDLDAVAPLVHWGPAGAKPEPVDVLLDVRGADEIQATPVDLDGVINIHLHSLADAIADGSHGIPDGAVVGVVCAIGKRAHVATCMLRAAGIDARTVSGGTTIRAPLIA